MLKEKRDHRLWEEVGGCQGAERYLKAFPKGLNAGKARECLEAEKEEKEEMRRRMKGYEEGAYKALERGNVAGARRRLKELRKLDEKAPEVMDLEDAIAEAEEKLGTMREYAETGREALGRGDLEKARRYLERLKDAESPLAVELEETVEEAERDKAKEAEERRRAEVERKEREAEERRQAEAERKRKAEAEEAARRARAETERREREAEERRRAEAERKEREEEARKKRAQGPGTTLQDCPECPKMVVVPSGRFQMGSPSSEAGRRGNEGPVHEVTIARPFAVGVYEVTFGEWDACVSGGGCGGYRPYDEGWGRGKRPVINVSWNDAKAYVRWLSGRTEEAYRLLNESEWEYVARAGTETARYWGESERGQCRYANGADRTVMRHNSGWTTVDCDDGHYRTAPVGSYEANGFGLHDVLGNVWEWTEDCWNGSYAGAPRDGSAWTSGDCGRRVLRGGSWVNLPRSLRSAVRDGNALGLRFILNGFRVARTLTP